MRGVILVYYIIMYIYTIHNQIYLQYIQEVLVMECGVDGVNYDQPCMMK